MKTKSTLTAFYSIVTLFTGLDMAIVIAMVWFGLELPADTAPLPRPADGSSGFTTLIAFPSSSAVKTRRSPRRRRRLSSSSSRPSTS